MAKLQSTYSVLKSINLARLMQHHVILQNDEIILIHECFLAGNKQAKKFLWVYHIFIQDQTTLEQQLLLEANKEGKTNTKYGLAIALLCE